MRPLIAVTLAVVATGCGTEDQLVWEEEGGNEAHAGPVDDVAESTSAVTARICPSGATVKGVDVSYYQGTVNWASVKAAGRTFAIARISDGLRYPDSKFAQNWSGMKAAGIIRGAYQYFEPGQDATQQANMVITKVGRLGPGDLPVMLDVEATNGLSPATITARIHTWVDKVTAGTGKKPIIYTGAYFWDASVRSADFATYPLNVAWYGTTCPGEPNAWSGHHWVFHQYTDADRVSGISGNVDGDVFNGDLNALKKFAGIVPPAPDCDRTAHGLTWSCNGVVTGQYCTQIKEPSDPGTWLDNYVCSKGNLGMKFSNAGAIAGMRCTRITEPSDPDTWTDNYLCVPQTSPYHFKWSNAGPIAGATCLQFNEPADYKQTWNDNYLCWSEATQAVQTRGPFTWSSAGAVAGKVCTKISEPSDPNTWSDNYFCSDTDLGMRWSSAGPIAGMSCTHVTEGADPDSWTDNYLCVPSLSPYAFKWSSAGALSSNCVAWYESSDPHTWNDNYLCW